GRTRYRTECWALGRGTGETPERTERVPGSRLEEIEGIAATTGGAPRRTRDLRRPRQPRVPQTRRGHVCRGPAPAGTRDRGLEESVRAHGRPIRADPARDVRGRSGPRHPDPGAGRRQSMA